MHKRIIADYIEQKGTITPYVDNNWKIADMGTAPNVTFLSNSNGEGELANFPYISVSAKKDNGLTEYKYNFK